MVYKPPYVVGAVIIACTAVTAALWIFFKLREQWMNQWYKRLGCAAIMGVAVCGKDIQNEDEDTGFNISILSLIDRYALYCYGWH